MAPLGRTRRPKPVTASSQTVNSLSPAFSASTMRLVIRWLILIARLRCGVTPGQHRNGMHREFPDSSLGAEKPVTSEVLSLKESRGTSELWTIWIQISLVALQTPTDIRYPSVSDRTLIVTGIQQCRKCRTVRRGIAERGREQMLGWQDLRECAWLSL